MSMRKNKLFFNICYFSGWVLPYCSLPSTLRNQDFLKIFSLIYSKKSPGTPGTSGTLGAPGTPGTPGTLGIPGTSGTPGTPSSPDISNIQRFISLRQD